MKLFCFTPQHVKVEQLLGEAPCDADGASVESPTPIAAAADLKAQASPGDILVIASNGADHPPGEFFTAARAIGMAVWSLSDHWVKPAELPATADGGEPPAQ